MSKKPTIPQGRHASIDPERLSADKLGGWTGIPGTTIRKLLGHLGISGPDGYEAYPAIPALIEHFRTIADKTSRETAESTAREKRANAENAEIDLAVKLGKLVSRDEMRRLLEQVIVKFREDIRVISWLTLEQKKTICDLVAKMVLSAPGEEGGTE